MPDASIALTEILKAWSEGDRTALEQLGGAQIGWDRRAHFFAASARLMRQILIDFARAEETDEHGKRSPHVDLSAVKNLVAAPATAMDFVDLDAALNELARLDSRQAQIVELRYFGGMENAEVAAVLGVSEPTIIRDWPVARSWLFGRLQLQLPAALSAR